ncbi:unnamed protein product [Diplocarpon coronariae]
MVGLKVSEPSYAGAPRSPEGASQQTVLTGCRQESAQKLSATSSAVPLSIGRPSPTKTLSDSETADLKFSQPAYRPYPAFARTQMGKVLWGSYLKSMGFLLKKGIAILAIIFAPFGVDSFGYPLSGLITALLEHSHTVLLLYTSLIQLMAFEKEYPSPSILGGKRLSRKELRKASRELDQASRSKDTWSYGFAALQHGVCLDILAKAASRKAKTSTLHNEHSSHAVIHGATPRTIKEQPGFELPPRAQSTPVYYVTRPTSQPDFKRVFTENFDKLSVDMEDGRRKFPRRIRDMRKCERARKAWTGDLEAFCSVVEPNPSPMITVGPSLESSDILTSTPDFIGPRERPTLPRSFSAFGKKAPGRSWDSMSPCREDRKSTSISRGKD